MSPRVASAGQVKHKPLSVAPAMQRLAGRTWSVAGQRRGGAHVPNAESSQAVGWVGQQRWEVPGLQHGAIKYWSQGYLKPSAVCGVRVVLGGGSGVHTVLRGGGGEKKLSTINKTGVHVLDFPKTCPAQASGGVRTVLQTRSNKLTETVLSQGLSFPMDHIWLAVSQDSRLVSRYGCSTKML